MQLETNRLQIVSFEAELFMPLYQLFCKNETVMQSAFKGRTLTKKEFLDTLANNFILNDTDSIGFVCVLDKTTGDFVGFTGLIPCDFLRGIWFRTASGVLGKRFCYRNWTILD